MKNPITILCWFAASMVAHAGSTVFIISLDGIRPDYLQRTETPFFDGMMAQGIHSLEMIPVFPTVTFQSHVNIATGAKPDVHGITANTFYDKRTQTIQRFAGPQKWMEAEPIWTTATRQGVRTLVLDWVKSHSQTGPYAAAYFSESYTRNIADQERINRVLTTWEQDQHEQPLRLVMAYAESPDVEGHRYGPDAPETVASLTELDHFLAEVYQRVKSLWRRQAQEGDELYFLVISDHGMAHVHTHVDLSKAVELDPRLTFIPTSSMAHIFFDQIEDAGERQLAIERLEAKLKDIYPLTVHRRETLPRQWHYAHPYRTGDLVITVPSGYALMRHDGDHVLQPSAVNGRLFGAHGYDPDTCADMTTVFFATRYPTPLPKQNLGRISTSQIHATLARILNIAPSPQAWNQPLWD